MKRIAVVLSGCGNKDGSEITETVSLLVSLSEGGAQANFFAPNQDFQPLNFLTNKEMGVPRNIMLESARITRSQIQDLATLDPYEFDGLALPGGLGAARHLSNWAEKKSACEVLPALANAIESFHRQSKPIAAICIAPAVVARVLGRHQVTVTLGEDPSLKTEIEKTGAIWESCPVNDYITDRLNKVISTPAYMVASARPHEIFFGIRALTKEFLEMC